MTPQTVPLGPSASRRVDWLGSSVQHLLRRLVEGIPYGMALEGLTAADLACQN